MRTLIVIPITIAIAAAIGWMICLALGFSPHPREMMFASVACFAASELAVVPLFVTRSASQLAVAQACLVGSMVHLMGCATIGGAMMLIKSLGLDAGFVYWLLAFYWLTLVVLVAAFIRALKAAPVTTAATAARQN